MSKLTKNYDIIKGFTFAFNRFLDPQILKWAAVLAFASGFIDIIQGLVEDMGMYHPAVTMGMAGIALLAVIPVIIVGLYTYPRLLREGLRIVGLKSSDKVPGVVDWAVFSIRMWFITTFCWYDKRFLIGLAIAIISFVMMIAGIVLMPGNSAMGILMILGIIGSVIGMLVWMVGYYFHDIRLIFAPVMFVRGDGVDSSMPKRSWDFVKGMTVELFITLLLAGLLVGMLLIIPLAVGFGLYFVSGTLGTIVFVVITFPIYSFSTILMADILRHLEENVRGSSASPRLVETSASKKTTTLATKKKTVPKSKKKGGKTAKR